MIRPKDPKTVPSTKRHKGIMLFLVTFAFAAETCAPEKTPCTGIGEVRMERDKDWTCNPVTQHPNIQVPIICGRNNKFIPRILTLKNESVGNEQYRVAVVPTFAKENGIVKYEFKINELSCDPFHAVIDVVNHMERTPDQVIWEVTLAIILFLVFFSVCVCAAFEDKHHRSSSSDFFLPYMLGRSSCSNETEVSFE